MADIAKVEVGPCGRLQDRIVDKACRIDSVVSGEIAVAEMMGRAAVVDNRLVSAAAWAGGRFVPHYLRSN